MNKELILLDDGQFYIERNCNGDKETTNGYLLRRCETGQAAPEACECIGGYERQPSGAWCASVNAPYDEDTDSDCREIGFFRPNLDAIAAL